VSQQGDVGWVVLEAFGEDYKVTFDPAYHSRRVPRRCLGPWMLRLACRGRGVTIYPFGGSRLAVEVDGRPGLAKQLAALPGWACGRTATGRRPSASTLTTSAGRRRWSGPHRRRRLSPEGRAKLAQRRLASEGLNMPRSGGWPATGFGARLKAERERAALSQRELAERAGCHYMTISELERGTQEPAWPLVLALAKALGVSCEAVQSGGEQSPAAQPAPKPSGGKPAPRKGQAADLPPAQEKPARRGRGAGEAPAKKAGRQAASGGGPVAISPRRRKVGRVCLLAPALSCAALRR
jgi:transcriptional regulator with XRE-family HTH domain